MPRLVAAVAAFVAVARRLAGRAERRVVTQYARDWTAGHYRAMYALLDSDSRAGMSQRKFASEYTSAADTSTMTKLAVVSVGQPARQRDPRPDARHDRLFGVLHETLEVPVVGTGSNVSVRFSRELVFPGMRPGERLHRQVELAPRAALLASDGTPLAKGPQRTSPIPDVAGQIAGTVGADPGRRGGELRRPGLSPGRAGRP